MKTPKIATFYISLEGDKDDDVRVTIKTKPDDSPVGISRAQVIGIPCFLESQLGFLPNGLRDTVIGTVAGIVDAEKQLVELPTADEPATSQGFLAPIADFTVELFNAPRGPVATVDSKYWAEIDKSAAMSLALVNSVRRVTKLSERDEVIRLLVLLDIGVRMWMHKKPTRMLYLTGASVYNRPNWLEFRKIMEQIGWGKYSDLFPNSFNEFLQQG